MSSGWRLYATRGRCDGAGRLGCAKSRPNFLLVPRRGAKQTRLVNSLSYPTFTKPPIESQWIFLRLSHSVIRRPIVRFSLISGRQHGSLACRLVPPRTDLDTVLAEVTATKRVSTPMPSALG